MMLSLGKRKVGFNHMIRPDSVFINLDSFNSRLLRLKRTWFLFWKKFFVYWFISDILFLFKLSKTTVSPGKISTIFVNNDFNGHFRRKGLEKLKNISHSSMSSNVRISFNLFLLQDQNAVAKGDADFIKSL